MEVICQYSLGKDMPGRCYGCTKELTGRRTRWCSADCCAIFWSNHHWNTARKMAKRRDKYKCTRCSSKEKLEVNHIVPLAGRSRSVGCLNHLNNLETLCRSCHQKTTNEQRKARAKKK